MYWKRVICSLILINRSLAFLVHMNSIFVSVQQNDLFRKQECIPVVCVPSAAVAVCRGGGGEVLAPAGECLPDRTLRNLMDRHVAVFHFSMGKCGKEGKKLFWDWNKWNLDKF